MPTFALRLAGDDAGRRSPPRTASRPPAGLRTSGRPSREVGLQRALRAAGDPVAVAEHVRHLRERVLDRSGRSTGSRAWRACRTCRRQPAQVDVLEEVGQRPAVSHADRVRRHTGVGDRLRRRHKLVPRGRAARRLRRRRRACCTRRSTSERPGTRPRRACRRRCPLHGRPVRSSRRSDRPATSSIGIRSPWLREARDQTGLRQDRDVRRLATFDLRAEVRGDVVAGRHELRRGTGLLFEQAEDLLEVLLLGAGPRRRHLDGLPGQIGGRRRGPRVRATAARVSAASSRDQRQDRDDRDPHHPTLPVHPDPLSVSMPSPVCGSKKCSRAVSTTSSIDSPSCACVRGSSLATNVEVVA